MRRLGAFQIGSDHPCLPGHFPGGPVVPGVVLLDEVLAMLLVAYPGRAAGLPRVKFLRPVLPDQPVCLTVEQAASGRLDFLASVDGQPVLRGSVVLTIA